MSQTRGPQKWLIVASLWFPFQTQTNRAVCAEAPRSQAARRRRRRHGFGPPAAGHPGGRPGPLPRRRREKASKGPYHITRKERTLYGEVMLRTSCSVSPELIFIGPCYGCHFDSQSKGFGPFMVCVAADPAQRWLPKLLSCSFLSRREP